VSHLSFVSAFKWLCSSDHYEFITYAFKVGSSSKLKIESSGKGSRGSWRVAVAGRRKTKRKTVPSKEQQVMTKKQEGEPDIRSCPRDDSTTRWI
jgi:hypothetical protein